LYTDDQATEHIATQPTMNEYSRSIDTRHHGIRQDYVDGDIRIGGVASQDNESDILTKFLQPSLHEKHTTLLHIKQDKQPTSTQLSNCVLKLTSNGGERLPSTPTHRTLAKTHQLPLNPPEKTTRHHDTIRTHPQPYKAGRTVLPRITGVPNKDRIHRRQRHTHKQHVKILPRTFHQVEHHQDVRLRGPPYTRHGTTDKQEKVKTVKDMFPPTFLQLILNGLHSQPPPPGAVTKSQSNYPPNHADDTGDGPRNNSQTKTNPIPPSVHINRPTKDLLTPPTAPSKIHTHIKTNGPQHHLHDPPTYTNTMITQKWRNRKRDRTNFDKFLQLRFVTI
jgi:hypothetical protein